MTITLYHYWRSSCSWRVRWALRLKSVPYTAVPINILAGEQRGPDYLRRNPSGFLPAIAIDGQCFGESMAIIEWLEELHPKPPLYPAEPLARLHVRQLALTIVAGTQPLQNPSVLSHFVPEESARKDHARHFIRRGLETYTKLLEAGRPGRCSHGDQVTVADLCLIPQVYNALRFDVDLKEFPRIRSIYEHCLTTPECADASPARFEPTV